MLWLMKTSSLSSQRPLLSSDSHDSGVSHDKSSLKSHTSFLIDLQILLLLLFYIQWRHFLHDSDDYDEKARRRWKPLWQHDHGWMLFLVHDFHFGKRLVYSSCFFSSCFSASRFFFRFLCLRRRHRSLLINIRYWFSLFFARGMLSELAVKVDWWWHREEERQKANPNRREETEVVFNRDWLSCRNWYSLIIPLLVHSVDYLRLLRHYYMYPILENLNKETCNMLVEVLER